MQLCIYLLHLVQIAVTLLCQNNMTQSAGIVHITCNLLFLFVCSVTSNPYFFHMQVPYRKCCSLLLPFLFLSFFYINFSILLFLPPIFLAYTAGMFQEPYEELLLKNFLPSIPVQPVSYGDIFHFMNQLSDHTPPQNWIGGLNLTYKITQSNDNTK